jgi:magnesium-transporting ATPase (P-type)
MGMQVLLIIITFGIYAYYWYLVTLKEMGTANGKDAGSGCLWTILIFIPIANFFAYWHHASEYTQFSQRNLPTWLVFVLWLFFSPAVWYLVQTDLNQAAPPVSSGGG